MTDDRDSVARPNDIGFDERHSGVNRGLKGTRRVLGNVGVEPTVSEHAGRATREIRVIVGAKRHVGTVSRRGGVVVSMS